MSDNTDISHAEELLELPQEYSLHDVNLAYRSKCKEMHPDARKDVPPEVANYEMSQVTAAYSTLRKQFRGTERDTLVIRRQETYDSFVPATRKRVATRTSTASMRDDFDPFGHYGDYIDIDRLYNTGTVKKGQASGYVPVGKKYQQQTDTWNTKLATEARYHYSHIDPHFVNRNRNAHVKENPSSRTTLTSSCDGPGWWRDLAWCLPEDPAWYRCAMQIIHWMPWTFVIYIIALLFYPLPILSEYGEMLLVGKVGSPIWFYSLFIMIFPFIGWLARHWIHDFFERVFAFPFRLVHRLILRHKHRREERKGGESH